MSKVLLPVIGTRSGQWIRFLVKNRIPIRYWHRVITSSLIIAAGIPFRRWQHINYGRKINASTVEKPLFILGHWRSGTTHLHNLLTCDTQFGYISYLQGLFPYSFLGNKVFRRFMEWTMPETRPMDNMKMSVTAAQEGEVPMASLHGRSMYTGWYFPREMRQYFNKWVLFEEASREEISQWKKDYLFLLKAASFSMQGKPLVLKSPANSARIRILLEMFPQARFIHIHRHPLTVFLSTRKLYRTALAHFQLQDISREKVEAHFIQFYRDLMQSFFRQQSIIPEAQFLEISYDDLVNQPIPTLSRVYEQFQIENLPAARKNWTDYLSQKKSYKPNTYQVDEATKALVKEKWGFAAEALGYTFTD